MKTINKIILLLVTFIASQILWSCSLVKVAHRDCSLLVKVAHLKKRHYMKGYYVDVIKRNNATKMLLNKEIDDKNNEVIFATISEQKTDVQNIQPLNETTIVSAEIANKMLNSVNLKAGNNNKFITEYQNLPQALINRKNTKKKISNNIRKIPSKYSYIKIAKQHKNSSLSGSGTIGMILLGIGMITIGILLLLFESGPGVLAFGILLPIIGLFLIISAIIEIMQSHVI